MHTILYLEVETLGEIICIYNILYTAATVMMCVIPLFMPCSNYRKNLFQFRSQYSFNDTEMENVT